MICADFSELTRSLSRHAPAELTGTCVSALPATGGELWVRTGSASRQRFARPRAAPRGHREGVSAVGHGPRNRRIASRRGTNRDPPVSRAVLPPRRWHRPATVRARRKDLRGCDALPTHGAPHGAGGCCVRALTRMALTTLIKSYECGRKWPRSPGARFPSARGRGPIHPKAPQDSALRP